MQQDTKQYRVRRVGSVTFGLTLVCYGAMFLIHVFFPMLKYEYIFRLWPIVFLLLGGEILVENHKSGTDGCRIVYDFAAVVMLGLMLLFAMFMAVVDYGITHGQFYFGI